MILRLWSYKSVLAVLFGILHCHEQRETYRIFRRPRDHNTQSMYVVIVSFIICTCIITAVQALLRGYMLCTISILKTNNEVAQWWRCGSLPCLFPLF